MNYIFGLLIVPILSFISSVRTKEPCDFEDVACMTRRSQDIYATLATGIKGVLEPIDPLFLEKINTAVESLNYELYNVTLTGMKNCQDTQEKFTKKESSFHSILYCPHLVLNYYCKANGVLGSINVDAEGPASMSLDEYFIVFKGKYSQKISEKDQKPHLIIESYVIATDLKGKLTFKHDVTVRKENDQSDLAVSYINENYKTLEKQLLRPIMNEFMDVFLTIVKTYINIFPLEKILE